MKHIVMLITSNSMSWQNYVFFLKKYFQIIDHAGGIPTFFCQIKYTGGVEDHVHLYC
jgi:hypothetical protein